MQQEPGEVSSAERDELARGALVPPHEEPVNKVALRAVALDWLRRWQHDPAAERGAVAVVAAAEWMRSLAGLVAGQEPDVAKVIEAARIPWWR